MNICKDCGHPALNHFVLGTKCNIDGCDCWNSQRQIIMDDGSARIAELEAALEQSEAIRAKEAAEHAELRKLIEKENEFANRNAVEAIRAQAAEIDALKQAIQDEEKLTAYYDET